MIQPRPFCGALRATLLFSLFVATAPPSLKSLLTPPLPPRPRSSRKHWLPTVAIVAVTSALIAPDPYTAPTFRTTYSFSGFNRVLSGVNTGAFIAAVPASIYTVGLIKRDFYAQSTALLAAEAFADGFALDLAFKGITARKQPLQ